MSSPTRSYFWWSALARLTDWLPLWAGRRLLVLIGRRVGADMAGYRAVCERLIETAAPGVRPFAARYWRRRPWVRYRRWGVTLRLDLRDNLQRCIYFTGRYEPATLAVIADALRSGGDFLDVGAHIGMHSFAAADAMSGRPGRVVAFEPTSDSAAKIRAALERSEHDIEVVQLGLSDRSGRLTLRADDDWGEHDAGVRSAYNRGAVIEEIAVERFDTWNREHDFQPAVVKIDVEGAEYEVLRGMEELLRSHPPRVLVVELKDSMLSRSGHRAPQIEGFLSSHGYRKSDVIEYNAVFIHAGTTWRSQT